MALQLDRVNEAGITGNYLKIISSLLDFVNNRNPVRVGLYISKESRDAGEDIIAAYDYLLSVDLSRSEMYAALKEMTDFSGAEDV